MVPTVRASDELDLYGRVNVTVQHSDEPGNEQAEVRSNASRIGVKGEKELTPGLKAIYQLEWGVNVDSGEDEDDITPRNQFVGLEGAFGTIKLGRHDTALKESQGDFDLFDDLEGGVTWLPPVRTLLLPITLRPKLKAANSRAPDDVPMAMRVWNGCLRMPPTTCSSARAMSRQVGASLVGTRGTGLPTSIPGCLNPGSPVPFASSFSMPSTSAASSGAIGAR
jgi:hypothetical protein